jgi:rare lipoprotein A
MVILASVLFLGIAGEGVAEKATSSAPLARCPEKPLSPCVGVASWYGDYHHGRPMANGQKFDMHDETTVAHKHLPLGTRLRLTNQETKRSIDVVVRDRGPYVTGRDFDLSYAAAEKLKFVREGHVKLRVEYVVVPAPRKKRG